MTGRLGCKQRRLQLCLFAGDEGLVIAIPALELAPIAVAVRQLLGS